MQVFEGKTAVITGAASGIGRALAERFAAARMNVVLADIEQDALDRAVKEMEGRQYRVIGVQVDTMLRDSVQALAARAVGEFGKVHILCNNAGVALSNEASNAVWELPDGDWSWVMGAFPNYLIEQLRPEEPIESRQAARPAFDGRQKKSAAGVTQSECRSFGPRVRGLDPPWAGCDGPSALDDNGSHPYRSPKCVTCPNRKPAD